jgi:hypothetical protein
MSTPPTLYLFAGSNGAGKTTFARAYCPDIFYGGCCHGDLEEEVYAELCGIVREEIADRIARKQVLPQAMVRATRDLDFPEVSSTPAP